MNQCRQTIIKNALLWNKHEYKHSADIFVKKIFNVFQGTGLFVYSLKYKDFLMFPESIKRDLCHETS